MSTVALSDRQVHCEVLEKLILFGLACTLVFDTLNGALLNYGLPGGISALYKIALQVLMLCYLFSFHRQAFVLTLGVYLVIFCWAWFRFYFVDAQYFTSAFQELFKVGSLFAAAITISQFRSMRPHWVRRLFWFYLAILFLNITLSYIGLGDFSYGKFGAKGFLYGGNVIAGIIVCAASVLLLRAFKQSMFKFISIIALLLIMAILMGTKSAIIGIVMVVALIITFNLDTKSLAFAVGCCALALVVGFTVFDLVMQSQIIDRVVHFYNKGGISYAVFSGREQKLAYLYDQIIHSNVSHLLLGFNQKDLYSLTYQRVEFDFADMVIYFGLPMTTIIYFGLFILFLVTAKSPDSELKSASIIAFILLVFISGIAGHVIFNGVVTPIWGALIGSAIAVSKRRKRSLCKAFTQKVS